MSEPRCYHCGHLLPDINAWCPICTSPANREAQEDGTFNAGYRAGLAQGRQEGFAQCREMAALTVYEGIKFYNFDNGRHIGTWPPDCTHKEALISRIRALQPPREEKG